MGRSFLTHLFKPTRVSGDRPLTVAGASGEVASGPVARAAAGKISLSPKRVLEGSQARDRYFTIY